MNQLLKCIKLIDEWCSINKIDINRKKSRILILNKRINKNQTQNEIEKYPIVKNYKYLGITLDEKLNFKDHFEITKKKVTQRANTLKRTL